MLAGLWGFKPSIAFNSSSESLGRCRMNRTSSQEDVSPSGVPVLQAGMPYTTMRFSGTLVAEKGDELFYEWTIHITNATRSHYSSHRLWAQMKDGVSAAVMEAEPGVRKDGPPPRATP